MKFYDIDSLFTFGKYEGMSLAEVFMKDPGYLKYCAENIDEFYISPSAERELKKLSRDMKDQALMNVDFDKMSDDEIANFINNLDDEGGFDAKDFDSSMNWNGGPDDFDESSPFDEFEDGYDEDDFDNEGLDNFNDEDFNDGFEELY